VSKITPRLGRDADLLEIVEDRRAADLFFAVEQEANVNRELAFGR